MIIRYSRFVASRHAMHDGDYLFEWRPSWEGSPVSRDLAWDFDEPDQYPALIAKRKPGLMASRAEKAFHAAVSSGDPQAILNAAGRLPKYADAARTIAGLLLLESNLDRGMAILDEVIDGGADIWHDPFLRKYLPEAGLSVSIAVGVAVHLPLRSMSVALLLAELHQARNEEATALKLLGKVEATTHVRLSQAELLFEAGDFAAVLAVTEGVINDDDVTALMLAYRGRALAELDRFDEAVSTFARAIEFPNRAPAVRAVALVGRGMINEARGEMILAENDFTQALMEVPDDEEAQQHVRELIEGRTVEQE